MSEVFFRIHSRKRHKHFNKNGYLQLLQAWICQLVRNDFLIALVSIGLIGTLYWFENIFYLLNLYLFVELLFYVFVYDMDNYK